MNFTKYVGVSASIVATLLLSGCGSSAATNNADTVMDPVTVPVAHAGEDQHTKVENTVTLDASNSSDANNNTLTHTWSVVSQPVGSNITLSNNTSSHPQFVPQVAGTHVLSLVTQNGTTASAPVTVAVTTTTPNPNPVVGTPTPAPHNATPVAHIVIEGHTTFYVKTGEQVTLDASKSTDADHDQLTYKWEVQYPDASIVTLSDTTSSHPTFIADRDGSYWISLIVNDGTVDSATDILMLHSDPVHVNSQPVANAGADLHIKTGDFVSLLGTKSSDPDVGDTLTYKWSIQSKPAGSLPTLDEPDKSEAVFKTDMFGAYVIMLIVNDGTEDSVADKVLVTVTGPNLHNANPVALINGKDHSSMTTSSLWTSTIKLDGSSSTDADGDTLHYSWYIKSRPGSNVRDHLTNAHGPTTELVIEHGTGTWTVYLIAYDGHSQSSAATIAIERK